METEKQQLIEAIQNASTETAMQVNALAAKGFYTEGVVGLIVAGVFGLLFVFGGLIAAYGVSRESEAPIAFGTLLMFMGGLICIVTFAECAPLVFAPESQLILSIARQP
jgi:hypothetical protein